MLAVIWSMQYFSPQVGSRRDAGASNAHLISTSYLSTALFDACQWISNHRSGTLPLDAEVGISLFVRAGLCPDGVFLGDRDHHGDPLPEFIGTRPQDLADLMSGLLEANERMRGDGIDPVLKESHGLRLSSISIRSRTAMDGCTAASFITSLPSGSLRQGVSRFIRHARPNRSLPLHAAGPFRSTDALHRMASHMSRNVKVLNDTADLYPYFDCIEEAEFLYWCVRRALVQTAP